jgi:hypothetical protein
MVPRSLCANAEKVNSRQVIARIKNRVHLDAVPSIATPLAQATLISPLFNKEME